MIIFTGRMNVYNRSSIIEFYKKFSSSKLALEIWYEDVEHKSWKNPHQVKKDYGGAVSILKNSRVVFDIKGNDYRLVAAINYENGWLFIKFIGTHSQYDRIDADTVNMYRSKNKK